MKINKKKEKLALCRRKLPLKDIPRVHFPKTKRKNMTQNLGDDIGLE